MKALISIILSLVVFNNCLLNTTDYSTYIGKEVSFMIGQSEFSNYEEYQFIDNRPFSLSSISFYYPDNKQIVLSIYDFEFATQFRTNRDWDFEKVKKEKISHIEVYQDDKLIYDSAR